MIIEQPCLKFMNDTLEEVAQKNYINVTSEVFELPEMNIAGNNLSSFYCLTYCEKER